MALAVSRRGVWGLAAFLLLFAIAAGEVELGLAALIGATTIVELLAWLGPLSGGGDAGRERRSGR